MKVDQFWELLVPLLLVFEPTDAQNVDQIQAHIEGYGVPAWEIGPAPNDEWFLAFPAGRQFGNEDQIAALIAVAPQVEGWTFYDYRPRRPYRETFHYHNGIQDRVFNSDDFRFKMFFFQDGMSEIDVHVTDSVFATLSEGDAYSLGYFLIDTTIGGDVARASVESIFVKPMSELDADGVHQRDLHQAFTSTLSQIRGN